MSFPVSRAHRSAKQMAWTGVRTGMLFGEQRVGIDRQVQPVLLVGATGIGNGL
jgi:hypothetical protein